MATLQTLLDEVHVLKDRISAVEQRQLRFMRAWIASHMISPTSGPTTPTSPTSTATTSPAPIWRRTLQFLPALGRLLAEHAMKYLLPYIVPILVAGWGLLYGYGTKLWQWALGLWHWLGL